MSNKKAFVSYSWDDDSHKDWVAQLATDLRKDGVETILDQWHAVPGDQLPAFMEREIRENDYVLIICTPKYKLKSDQRKGGVGYEGDIMTAEVHSQGNHRKFIPVLARGTWEQSAPSWLKGKYFVDLSNPDRKSKYYSDLRATMLGTRTVAPPIEPTPKSPMRKPLPASPDEPLKIMGVIVDEVTEPRMDGTPGSALYKVPFRLNRTPSSIWSEIFIQTWNRPPRFTSMHRPGIAGVYDGAKILLDGTTLEEVKKYHRETLIICIDEANKEEARILELKRNEEVRKREKSEAHRRSVEDQASGLTFD